MSPLACFLLVAFTMGAVEAYPDGAPLTACSSMFPQGHHTDAQSTTDPIPYEITVSKTAFAPSETIEVTVKGKNVSAEYEGVFLQARSVNCSRHDTPIGTFTIPQAADALLRTLACSHTGGAVTHKTSQHKQELKVNWTAPAESVDGPIYFRATFVEHVNTFWVNVFSPIINKTPGVTSANCPVKTKFVPETTTTTQKTTTDDSRPLAAAALVVVASLFIHIV